MLRVLIYSVQGMCLPKANKCPNFLKYTKILVEVKLAAWLKLMPLLRVRSAGGPVCATQ